MTIEYNHWGGAFKDVEKVLFRSISQYTRYYDRVKIGITNNPERRCNEHKNSKIKWDKMIVKYETSSVNFINRMETVQIDYNKNYIKNIKGGGGGPNGAGPYFLYVLLG